MENILQLLTRVAVTVLATVIAAVILHRLRLNGAIPPTALPAINLNGRWTNEDGQQIYDLVASLKVNGKTLTGDILWTLVQYPPSWRWARKAGDSAHEFVEGSIQQDKLRLTGKSVDDE